MKREKKNTILRISTLILALALLVSACTSPTAPPPAPTEPSIPLPAATNTPEPPTPTATLAPTEAPVDQVWENIQETGRIRVGISADYAPFAYVGDDFVIKGYDLALLTELSKRLDKPLDIQNMAFDGLLNSLQLGEIDLAVAAISVTEARDQLVDFSNIYFASEDAIVGDIDATMVITDPLQLAGYRLGVQHGSLYQDWVQDTLVVPGLMDPQDVLTYTTVQDALQALDPDLAQVELVMMDALPAELAQREMPVKIVARKLTPSLFAAALPQGAFELQAAINEALLQMQNDGTLARLAQDYLNIDNLAPLPTLAPTAIPATPAGCLDSMAFVADLNLPDNNMQSPPQFQPGTVFQKGWRIRNSGTCTWDNTYLLQFVGSSPVNAPVGGAPAAIQGTVAPGQTQDIFVTITAPWQPGRYQSFWQMRNTNGIFFGSRIWAGMEVVSNATPTPGPSAPVITRFVASPTQIEAGACTTITWEFSGQGITQARIFRNNTVVRQNLPSRGSGNDCLSQPGTYEYLLRVDSPGGTATAMQTVTVYQAAQPTPTPRPTAAPPVIYAFSADPNSVQVGECTTLSWSFGGDSLALAEIKRDNQVIAQDIRTQDALQDCPPEVGNYTYELKVSSEFGGTVKQYAYVSVLGVEPRDLSALWQWTTGVFLAWIGNH